jgi:putative peptidoglycan lipid II flippase
VTEPADVTADPVTAVPAPAVERSGRFALLVAAGILLSRIFGLVRGRVLAHYLGTSAAADAFGVALRGPNFLQNLFGEGVLSASFIPEYVRLTMDGDPVRSRQLASAVVSLLALVVSVLVALGVVFAPALVSAIAWGFEGATRDLTILLVRVLFPGTGLLVISAWCLGVLNSHRRFLLSYAAPVVWNLAIIAAIVWTGTRGADNAAVAIAAAWGAVIGSALQVAVQLPSVLRLLGGFEPAFTKVRAEVRRVFTGFAPVLVGRGGVQLSSWVDAIIASLLPTGAAAVVINYAQPLYLLPVSLFGMSVSAAELPAMSRVAGDDAAVRQALGERLRAGLRQITFFVVPSAVAFLALGGEIAGAVYQSGDFDRSDTLLVWGALAGYALGLVASTQGRLYASAFYALRDTRTPVKYSFVRIAVSLSLGFAAALWLPGLLGIDPVWGVVGLAAAASVGGWVEFLLLRRAMARRLGDRPTRQILPLLGASAVAAAAGLTVQWAVSGLGPILSAMLTLGAFGATYLAITAMLGVPEIASVMARIRRLTRRS